MKSIRIFVGNGNWGAITGCENFNGWTVGGFSGFVSCHGGSLGPLLLVSRCAFLPTKTHMTLNAPPKKNDGSAKEALPRRLRIRARPFRNLDAEDRDGVVVNDWVRASSSTIVSSWQRVKLAKAT